MDQSTINSILSQVDIKNTSIKNILITGCSGFIGAHILNVLLNKKFKNKFNIHGVDIVKPKILIESSKKNFFSSITNFFKCCKTHKKKSTKVKKSISL